MIQVVKVIATQWSGWRTQMMPCLLRESSLIQTLAMHGYPTRRGPDWLTDGKQAKRPHPPLLDLLSPKHRIMKTWSLVLSHLRLRGVNKFMSEPVSDWPEPKFLILTPVRPSLRIARLHQRVIMIRAFEWDGPSPSMRKKRQVTFPLVTGKLGWTTVLLPSLPLAPLLLPPFLPSPFERTTHSVEWKYSRMFLNCDESKPSWQCSLTKFEIMI